MYDWVDLTRKNEWRIYDQRQHLVQGKLKERMAICSLSFLIIQQDFKLDYKLDG